MSRWWIAGCAVVCVLATTGCSDDVQNDIQTDAGADAAGLADVVQEDISDESDATEQGDSEEFLNPDAGDDANEEDALEPDADGSGECPQVPAPLIGGTAQTDLLAQAPAQCGQAAFSWLQDDAAASLGEFTRIGTRMDFPADFIEFTLAELGVSSPREIKYDVHFNQFGYLTQDRGELIESSALIAYPTAEEFADEPRDMVLLLHGTTGFSDACAATDTLEFQGLAAAIASFGYVVVVPDYIGLKGVGEPTGFIHPYLVGQAAAISSIDAARAAMRLPASRRGDLCLNPRVVTVGGSQGGHAALWVDRLAPYYAREMDFAGTVATVPPADMLGQMDRAVKDLVKASMNSVAFYAASSGWYGYADRLDELLVAPLDEVVVEALAGDDCSYKHLMSDVASTDEIFQPEIIDAAFAGTTAELEPWGCMAAENGLTTTSVERIEPEDESYGILWVLGEDDELVHTPIERESFQTLCDAGMRMQYLECAGTRHGETTLLALPQILEFVDARLAGEAFDADDICQVTQPVTCDGGQ